MLIQRQVWAALRKADEQLRRMVAEGSPSAKHLQVKFDALHRRLYAEPPAGPSETTQRLTAMRDECRAELASLRRAVERALQVAGEHGGDWALEAKGPQRLLEAYFTTPTTSSAASRSTSSAV